MKQASRLQRKSEPKRVWRNRDQVQDSANLFIYYVVGASMLASCGTDDGLAKLIPAWLSPWFLGKDPEAGAHI